MVFLMLNGGNERMLRSLINLFQVVYNIYDIKYLLELRFLFFLYYIEFSYHICYNIKGIDNVKGCLEGEKCRK